MLVSLGGAQTWPPEINKTFFGIRESFVTDAVLVSRRVKSQKFSILYFQNERRYRVENLWKDIFLSHLQPGGVIKSEDLAIYDFRILWRHVKTSNTVYIKRNATEGEDKGRTIRKVMSWGGGGGVFEQHEFFWPTFLLQDIFFVYNKVFSGLPAVYELFFSHLSFACLFWYLTTFLMVHP